MILQAVTEKLLQLPNRYYQTVVDGAKLLHVVMVSVAGNVRAENTHLPLASQSRDSASRFRGPHCAQNGHGQRFRSGHSH